MNTIMFRKVLFWFFVVVLIKQLLWISYIPIWHFPDEQAHFGEVQNYAEGNPINPARSNNTSKEIDDSEILLETKRNEMGNNKYIYHPEYNIPYANGIDGIHEDAIKKIPYQERKIFVSNEATAYPPAYYILASYFYKAMYSQDIFARVMVSRIFNLTLYSLFIYATYQIVKILFNQNRSLQLFFMLLIGFHPMLSFVWGGITSDNLFNLLFTYVIYLNLKILKEGWKIQYVILSIIVFQFSIWTKPQGNLTLILYIFPLMLSALSKPRLFFKVLLIAFLGSIFFKEIVVYFIVNRIFIPELPVLSLIKNLTLNSYILHMKSAMEQIYRETIPWYWGVFRWLSFTYPRIVHRSINWISVFSIIGLLVYILKLNKLHKNQVPLKFILFLIYTTFIYAIALNSFDYLFKLWHGFSLGLQGRYYFPTISAHMALITIGIYGLLNWFKVKNNLMKLVSILIIILHSYTFYLVTTSYFGSNLTSYFMKASQYKPYFFKSPNIEIFLGIYIISLLIFLWYYLRMKVINYEKS